MLIKDKTFWLAAIIAAVVLLLFVALGHTHETHLSDVGKQTNVTIKPCPILSGYVATSDQRDCFLIYKQTDMTHSAMHVQGMPLNEDGECVCPKGD